jgi:uncharacterized membrane protein YbhN (UPF0104 family)
MQQWKTWLKLVVAAVLVYWLIQHVDWVAVSGIVARASGLLIGGYVAVQLLGNLISAAKWRYLARIQGFSFSLRDGFFAYLAGAFINNFLPSTVGGDSYRVLWMSRSGERTKAFSVVFFDRITGLLALFLFSAIGISFLPWQLLLAQPAFIIFAAILFSVTIAMLIALLWTRGGYRLLGFCIDRLPWPRLRSLLRDFELLAHSRVYAKTIGWAVLFTAIGIGGSNYLLFSSLGADLAPLAFVSAIFAATLIANIPISINNIGVKEWSYVFFFGLIGVPVEIAVAAALCSRLLQMLISFIALPHYLGARKRIENSSEGRYSV